MPTFPFNTVYPVPLGLSVTFWLVPPAAKLKAELPVIEPVVVPVPPLARGTVPRLIAGVVVPVATLIGDVPDTLVTVPLPVPAPIAVRKALAVKADAVLSALNLGNVIAPGFVNVKRLLPTVVAPRLVLAPAAVVEPVPPLASATVPETLAEFPVILPEISLPVMVCSSRKCRSAVPLSRIR